MFLSSLVPLFLFITSLAVAMASSAWFTRRLEAICDIFNLSDSLLSLLGALGANIPNYAASITAIAHGQVSVGLGVIIGSNIYNVAIILAVSTFATSSRRGIALAHRAASDARLVAFYTIGIMCTTFISTYLLSMLPASNHGISASQSPLLTGILLVVSVVTLAIFVALSLHALHRIPHEDVPAAIPITHPIPVEKTGGKRLSTVRIVIEAVLALGVALGSVIVMVNAGQAFATIVHMPEVILGLLVLAVATSLPNTVVAFSLARTERATACVEEVLSSNSINAALGIALPLLIWHQVLHSQLLVYLDAPLMIVLTLVTLACIIRRRVSHLTAGLLLLTYGVWIVAHVIL